MATPLHQRIKIAYRYGPTDCTHCFKNTHNRYFTYKEKESTFRLLCNMTPFRLTHTKCPFCKTNTLREEHLFTQCPVLLPLHTSLQDTLEQLLKEEIDINRAIMLNAFPVAQQKTRQLIAHLLGSYRHIIWKVFMKKQCENTTMSAQTVSILRDYKQNNIIVQYI